MIHLRNKDSGEQVFTRSRDGYGDDWEVVNAKARRPRDTHSADEKRKAKLRTMDVVERHELLEAQITALVERVDRLERGVDKPSA